LFISEFSEKVNALLYYCPNCQSFVQANRILPSVYECDFCNRHVRVCVHTIISKPNQISILFDSEEYEDREKVLKVSGPLTSAYLQTELMMWVGVSISLNCPVQFTLSGIEILVRPNSQFEEMYKNCRDQGVPYLSTDEDSNGVRSDCRHTRT